MSTERDPVAPDPEASVPAATPPTPPTRPAPPAPPAAPGTIEPLPGEPGIPDIAQRSGPAVSRKAVIAGVVLIGSLVAMVGMSIHRFTSSKPVDAASTKRPAQRPSATAIDAKRLDLTHTPAEAASGPRIPALEPTADERAAPIALRSARSETPRASPEDAPVMLLSSRTSPNRDDAARDAAGLGSRDASRGLQDAQRQTYQLLDGLIRRSEAASSNAAGLTGRVQDPSSRGAMAASVDGALGGTSGLLGGAIPKSSTPQTEAALLRTRSLMLPKGTTFTCALKTRIVSATAGLVGCQVQRNVYSDDGRVLLVERGSHLDGEYRITTVKPGTVRIPLLWTRLRTPNGVTVDLDSPGIGPLGESGVDGEVDNRWSERIGAALLLSFIDDAVRITVAHQAANQTNGVVLSSTTDTGSDLAGKVLDSTISIPPVITQHQGAIVGVHVARDVDFSSVYELMPTELVRRTPSSSQPPTGALARGPWRRRRRNSARRPSGRARPPRSLSSSVRCAKRWTCRGCSRYVSTGQAS
jgi:type IV secretion system protein VirB10